MRTLEFMMTEYLGVEDCIAFGMGFAANALNIPVIMGKVTEHCIVPFFINMCIIIG